MITQIRLRQALERIAREGWERSREPGDDAFVLASLAEDALAGNELTLTPGSIDGRIVEWSISRDQL